MKRVFLMGIVALVAWLQISSSAAGPACEDNAPTRSSLEDVLRENNEGFRVAIEVRGGRARELAEIFNTFPPPSNLESDLSILYTASYRAPLWVLYLENCAVGSMALPNGMHRGLFGEIGFRV